MKKNVTNVKKERFIKKENLKNDEVVDDEKETNDVEIKFLTQSIVCDESYNKDDGKNHRDMFEERSGEIDDDEDDDDIQNQLLFYREYKTLNGFLSVRYNVNVVSE